MEPAVSPGMSKIEPVMRASQPGCKPANFCRGGSARAGAVDPILRGYNYLPKRVIISTPVVRLLRREDKAKACGSLTHQIGCAAGELNGSCSPWSDTRQRIFYGNQARKRFKLETAG